MNCFLVIDYLITLINSSGANFMDSERDGWKLSSEISLLQVRERSERRDRLFFNRDIWKMNELLCYY